MLRRPAPPASCSNSSSRRPSHVNLRLAAWRQPIRARWRPGQMDIQALLVTLRLAAATTLILLVIATPLAYWIATTRSRVRAPIEALTTLPILLPPTVLGFYLLVLLGSRTSLGRIWIHLTGHTLAFTFTGLVIGSVVYSLPFAVQPIVAGFSSVDPALIEQARILGATRFRILARVMLPLSARSVAAAALLCFTHTVGE